MENLNLTLGAIPNENTIHCLVWLPNFKKAYLEFKNKKKQLMKPNKHGFYSLEFDKKYINMEYFFSNGRKNRIPDPATRYQAQGVHGPSTIIDLSFPWSDQHWQGLSLEKYIIYELHVGTYTKQGSFQALIPYLDGLIDLGITAIELMPCGQFPGHHNWGYDVVFPFAIQNSYGKPSDLQHFVDLCHSKGLAVIMDVVFNHLGTEGNIFHKIGPYFTDKYITPWGKAINFDDAYSDYVRQYFLENAIYWFTQYHIDALRLDALHAIYDKSAYPFLSELSDTINQLSKKTGRQLYLIGENDLNDIKLITPRAKGGHGIHAQWNDDFHHALHALLTDEQDNYYQDFGSLQQFAKAYQDGFVYDGIYSHFRNKRHGSSSKNLPGSQFVVFTQNHDQIGNRLFGDRLSQHLSLTQLKLCAALTIFSANIPLIFMGEEYGENAPFHYFTNHSDKELIKTVREGRKTEFAFKNVPNPQNNKQFLSSKLNHELKLFKKHQSIHEFYRRLIYLRKTNKVLSNLNNENISINVNEDNQSLLIVRKLENASIFIICHFTNKKNKIVFELPPGCWNLIISNVDKSKLPTLIKNQTKIELTLMPYEIATYQKI